LLIRHRPNIRISHRGSVPFGLRHGIGAALGSGCFRHHVAVDKL